MVHIFFDQLDKFIAFITGKIVCKGRQAKDIISMKSEISTCEDIIRRSYSAIGRKYYEAHKADEDAEFSKEIRQISIAMSNIEELNAQIGDIKNK